MSAESERRPWRKTVEGPDGELTLGVEYAPCYVFDAEPWWWQITLSEDADGGCGWGRNRQEAKDRVKAAVAELWQLSGKSRPEPAPKGKPFDKPARRAIIAAAADVADALRRENAEAESVGEYQPSSAEAMRILRGAIMDAAGVE